MPPRKRKHSSGNNNIKEEQTSTWQEMRSKMDQLESEMTSVDKMDVLNKIALQIIEILDENSNESRDIKKIKFLEAIKNQCDAKMLELITEKISHVETVCLYTHGKHDVPYTVSAIWYNWRGKEKKYIIAYGRVTNNYSGEITNSAFLTNDEGNGLPDDLTEYIQKWGSSSLSEEELENGGGDNIAEAIESESILDLNICDYLLPVVFAFQ